MLCLSRNILQWRFRLVVFISIVILCINCIDPYIPNLEKFESLLVVDALVTDEYGANYVKIARSSKKPNKFENVSGAQVYITDDLGVSTTLTENLEGEYWTDPALFRGEVGRSYALHIIADGEEYQSDPCLMYPSTEIDSLNFYYHEEIPTGYSEDYSGIEISIDSDPESVSGYRRWTYEEWWKFKVPYPAGYKYISEREIVPIETTNEVCYGHYISDEINVYVEGMDFREKLSKPILFRASQLSYRFQIQYSIEIKQLSISREEYEFWKNLKLLNDEGGDIFDKQPFSVVGNVKNVSHPSQNALGYFQVSAVSKKQTYITRKQIQDLGLYKYQDGCERKTASPADYRSNISWDEVYRDMLIMGYTFIGYETDLFNNLSALAFVKSVCADCTKSGILTKPDFWVDL